MCTLYKDLTEENVKDKWKQQRNQALPFNSHLVLYRTKKEGGVMLPKKDWITIDIFRIDLRKCRSNSAKWGMINYATCECEVPIQTIQQLFNGCPLTKYVKGQEDVQ